MSADGGNGSSPSASVILPTYNRADVLGRAIQDVLNQTYTDFELIVVDSGSDNAKEVVESFDDDRISYYWQEPRGLSAARNFGMEQAQSDIYAFQDDDDEWHPKKLAKQMEVFDEASSDIGVVYTGIWKINGDEKYYVPGENVEPKEGDIYSSLQSFNFVSPQTTAVRKQCFDEVGEFDESLIALEDWEMWLRISQEFEFRYIDQPLATANIRPDSLSKNYKYLSISRHKIVNKHYESFVPKARARHLFWAGHGMMKTGQTRKGRRNLFRAMLDDLKLMYVVAFLVSLLGSTVYQKIYRMYNSPQRLTPASS